MAVSASAAVWPAPVRRVGVAPLGALAQYRSRTPESTTQRASLLWGANVGLNVTHCTNGMAAMEAIWADVAVTSTVTPPSDATRTPGMARSRAARVAAAGSFRKE